MVSNYVWYAVAGGLFAAGIAIGYSVFASTYTQPGFMFNQQLILERMQQDQQFGRGMMGGMTADPALRQQMFDAIMQDPQAMQQWMGDAQFQQEWYPYMMHNWMMGPGMGPGMMGGPISSYGIDTSSIPEVRTDKVEIPQNAWSPRSTAPYDPLRIEVEPGTTATWTNNDDVVHTVTDVDNGFDSELINPSESWSYTFESEGEYNYYCSIHPWMKGTVEVE